MFNEYEIRKQFPILQQNVHGKPLVYLDSAATSQKPQVVIDAESQFYSQHNAGVHRGAHELASLATTDFEESRATLARFIGANYENGEEELVITPGATAGINLLATAIGYASLSPTSINEKRFALGGDSNIVISQAEHHSVLLPMQELCRRTGAELRYLPLHQQGEIDISHIEDYIDRNTKFVAVTHVSNVTGAITPIDAIVERAHDVGAYVILDACQSIPHLPVDVKKIDVDFAAFSVHKMYGPTGVGCLYGKRELLNDLPPVNMGGSMVQLAWLGKPALYMEPPARFEAGTQPVAQVFAAAVAAKWMSNLDMSAIVEHEQKIAERLLTVGNIPGIRILGPLTSTDRIATVSFDVEGVHPHDVGQFFDSQGIAIRVGHHCAQPVHRHFGLYASNRVSCGVYNTMEEIDTFIDVASQVRSFFK